MGHYLLSYWRKSGWLALLTCKDAMCLSLDSIVLHPFDRNVAIHAINWKHVCDHPWIRMAIKVFKMLRLGRRPVVQLLYNHVSDHVDGEDLVIYGLPKAEERPLLFRRVISDECAYK